MREDVGEDACVALGIAPYHSRILSIRDEDEVHHDVADGDSKRTGNGDLAQEAERFGEVDIFGRMLLIAHHARDKAGDDRQTGRGVTDSEGVVTGDFLHKRTHEIRGDDHVQCREDRSEGNQRHAAQPGIDTCSDEHEREPIKHVPRKEDGLPLGKAGEQHVDGKCHDHDDTDLGTELGADVYRGGLDGLRHHGIERRGDAVDGTTGNQTGTGAEHEKADSRHNRTAHDLGKRLFLQQQANHSDKRQEDCTLSEYFVDDEVKPSWHHRSFPLVTEPPPSSQQIRRPSITFRRIRDTREFFPRPQPCS